MVTAPRVAEAARLRPRVDAGVEDHVHDANSDAGRDQHLDGCDFFKL